METIIKYFTSMIIVIIWLLFSIAETAYCQHNKGSNGTNNDKEIVHNDKTGIVIDIVEHNDNGKSALVEDGSMGKILVSLPTKLAIDKGKTIIYRELKGDKGHNGKGNSNANANCNNDMCEIISVEN